MYWIAFNLARLAVIDLGIITTLHTTDSEGDAVQELGGSGEQAASLRSARGRAWPARSSGRESERL